MLLLLLLPLVCVWCSVRLQCCVMVSLCLPFWVKLLDRSQNLESLACLLLLCSGSSSITLPHPPQQRLPLGLSASPLQLCTVRGRQERGRELDPRVTMSPPSSSAQSKVGPTILLRYTRSTQTKDRQSHNQLFFCEGVC